MNNRPYDINRNNRIEHSSIYDSSILKNVNKEEQQKVSQFSNASLNPTKTNIIPRNFNKNTNTYLERPQYTRDAKNREGTIETLSGDVIHSSSFTHNNMQPFFGGQVRQNTNSNAYQPTLELFTGTSQFDKQKEEIAPLFSPHDNVTNIHGTQVHSSTDFDRYIPSRFRQGELLEQPTRVGPGLNKGYTSEPTGGFQQFDMLEYAKPKTVDELRAANKPKLSYEGVIIPGKGPTQRGTTGDLKKNKPYRYYKNSVARYSATPAVIKKETIRSLPNDKVTARQETTSSYVGASGPAVFIKNNERNEVYPEPKTQQLETFGVTNASAPNKWLPNDVTGDYGKNTIENKDNIRTTTQDNKYVSNVVSVVKALIAPIEDLIRHTRKENAIGNIRLSGNVNLPVKNTPVFDSNDIPKATIKETNIHNERTGNMKPQESRSIIYDPEDITRTTIKETNIENSHAGFINNTSQQITVIDPDNVMRTTTKELTIDNNHNGNIRGPTLLTVYDPNDISRTTIKETNIENNYTGSLKGSQRLPVYDPNDVQRTTIKQTNIHHQRTGNFGALPSKQPVKDPTDITKTTIKETNIHNVQSGQLAPSVRFSTVYDPNDIAKTTIKETNIHNTRKGNVAGYKIETQSHDVEPPKTTSKETLIHEYQKTNLNAPTKPAVYDPNDILKTTIKETNIENNRTGNVTGKETQYGYITNEYEAKATHKQFLSDNEYIGDATAQSHGAYKVTEYDAKDVSRQYLADNEYSGGASSYLHNPTSYDDAYNATLNPNKQEIALGREPTHSNVKLLNSNINLDIKKIEENNERELSFTKVINLFSESPEFTKEKQFYKNDDRNNPDLLKPFAENPYTKSLNSFA
jgi:hypothetical protein